MQVTPCPPAPVEVMWNGMPATSAVSLQNAVDDCAVTGVHRALDEAFHAAASPIDTTLTLVDEVAYDTVTVVAYNDGGHCRCVKN